MLGLAAAIFIIAMFVIICATAIVIIGVIKFSKNTARASQRRKNNGFYSNNNWNFGQEQQRIFEEQAQIHQQQIFQEQQRQCQQQQFDEQNRQFQQWSMDENMKAATPFEMGGYDMNQGNSFNNPNMF